jgi:hypothetical protein
MRTLVIAIAALALAAAPSVADPSAPVTIVICAPGYPGDTEQAQSTMDALAQGLARSSGWSPSTLSAVYYETLEAGLSRLDGDEPSVALVGLPFYLEYRERLQLTPLLQIVPTTGQTEQWALVAQRSSVSDPTALAGWELASLAGYAPGFVRRVALAGWGELPEEVEIGFSSRVLSKLRKAASGEQVAVLLDRGQTEALDQLAFGEQLEVVARSEPLPPSLVCAVGDRIATDSRTELTRGFKRLNEIDGGDELLESIRVEGFADLDADRLDEVERRFDEH